ncbi:helix-turn-helix transcriptional regulator [Xenorhabdus khoisanae]|uniref:helix-turn-helix transcriptional regulator n=1 Tax=Xenorhabdus khoisanae TaxID=880157 RepID=UPI002358D464|nr:helix-turn-helix transcriptional regulator [Xenorhabdus khoisanae]MDC9615846.1 helix-turn-helix transcriptional regulator [Xenorhabdus khoisanae]
MNKLRLYREQLGLTQSELAVQMGCTAGAICHYETGRRKIDLVLCRKFVEIFNSNGASVSLDDIFPPKAA